MATLSFIERIEKDLRLQDLRVDNNNLRVERGVEDVRQRVTERLCFLFGEWFLHRSAGMRYVDGIFNRPDITDRLAANLIANEVAQVDGVFRATVLEYEVDASRKLHVRIRVTTTESDIFEVDTAEVGVTT